jgi:ATP-dependent helicase/nuclease subunit B
MHKIFEGIFKKNDKSYASLSLSEVEKVAKPYFDDLREMYPFQVAQMNMMEERMLNQIMKSLSFLKDMEGETSFVPAEAEFRYTHPIKINDDIELTLVGSIDRFDETVSHVRVMDYKSSDKDLNVIKVLTGQQLQLLTYLWVASQKKAKKSMGAYYISLKQPDIYVTALAFDIKKMIVTEIGSDDWEITRQNALKLSGWTFDDPKTLDYHGRFIKSLKVSKDDVKLDSRSAYDFDLVIEVLNQLYKDFANRLTQGDISRKCTSDACAYCDYLSFCQFNLKPINIVNRTTIESLKKGSSL